MSKFKNNLREVIEETNLFFKKLDGIEEDEEKGGDEQELKNNLREVIELIKPFFKKLDEKEEDEEEEEDVQEL